MGFLDQEAMDAATALNPRVTAIENAGGATFAKLTADQPFTTTSLANVTGLAFAVTAGTLYRFSFDVIFRSAATTTGIGLGLTGPAVTSLAATARIPIGADGAGGELQGWLTSSGDAVIGTGVQAIGTDYLARLEGVVLPSANGTVQLQARSEIAASQITVRNGSVAAWQAIP